MKLKSLLLGSAAALITLSGANAADAVFAAEPEPTEYVKVCDVYGSGFFYIPGTETCLQISGEVRSQITYNRDPDATATTVLNVRRATAAENAPGAPFTFATTLPDGTPGPRGIALSTVTPAAEDYWSWTWRARLNIDARTETDYGMLRGRIRFNTSGNGAGSAGTTSVDHALISLGGFTIGYGDSTPTTWHGYGFSGANDGHYSFDDAVYAQYVFAANGFSAVVGVQDTDAVLGASGSDAFDPYAGIKYAGSWGNIAGTIIYDNGASEIAWKASAEITAITNLTLKGWYHADNGGTAYVANGATYEWGVGAHYNINSQFGVYAGYSDADAVAADYVTVGAQWRPVSGFLIQPEVNFQSGGDVQEYRLRIVRSF